MLDYQQLVDSVKEYNNDSIASQTYTETALSDFSQLSNAYDSVSFAHDFDTAIQDLNDIIAQWNLDNPISNLMLEIDSFVSAITDYDDAISALEIKLKNIIRLPDRHNKGTLCNNLTNYIYNAGSVHYKDVCNETNTVIPEYLRLIDNLLEDFRKERADISSNKEMAGVLLERLEVIKTWPDRYRKGDLVAKCESILNQVIHDPNKNDPQSDRNRLDNMTKGMDGFEQMFENEKVENERLREELKERKNEMWISDYENLMKVLKRNSKEILLSSPMELKSQMHDYIVDKKNFITIIDNELAKLSVRQRKKFSDRFEEIRNNPVPKRNANYLLEEIRDFKKKRKKVEIMLWVGIALSGGIALVLTIFS